VKEPITLVIEALNIYFVCLIVTYLEVIFLTNELTMLSFPLPSWGGRKADFTRKLASLPTGLR